MLAKLRSMAKDSLDKHLCHNAIMLVELIFRMPGFDMSDVVFSAQCYFQNGEIRRSLAVLESKGLLGIENIQLIADIFANEADANILLDRAKKHIFSAVLLASKCLLCLEQYEDCLALLEPILSKEGSVELLKSRHLDQFSNSSEVNMFAGLFHIAGRCFDMLENRPRAIRAFTTAVEIDVACVEAIDYMIQNSLLSRQDITDLLSKDLNFSGDKAWFRAYHQYLLTNSEENDSLLRMALSEGVEEGESDTTSATAMINFPSSTTWLIQNAEYSYYNYHSDEAYRLSRQAYSMDPFDNRGLLIYIASLVDLNLKTELFYLGHELSHAYPKLAISWYAIGCYYWCCKKLELAQKFLQKCTKLDKRFSKGWIVLGMVLSAQEESEHAISAFRAATRLLPGDYRPLAFMSKELVRTCNLSLAQHLLNSALELNPSDPIILNELGIILVKNNMLPEALSRLKEAITLIEESGGSASKHQKDYPVIYTQRHSGCEEIFNNYATCLRKCGFIEEALIWYEKCLGIDQNNANTHANIAFTHHISGNLEKAISSYHRALSLEPTMTICSDMMSHAIEDFTFFPDGST